MRADAYVNVRLRCLEMANERAFDVNQVLPLAVEYERFVMESQPVDNEGNVVDMNRRPS